MDATTTITDRRRAELPITLPPETVTRIRALLAQMREGGDYLRHWAPDGETQASAIGITARARTIAAILDDAEGASR